MPVFHIKICGVCHSRDVDAVGQSRADAIGFNFFPRSVRYLDPSTDATVALSRLAAESGLVRVGVFVNASADQIVDTVAKVGLEHVQLHGDESVELASDLITDGLSVVRAVRLPPIPFSPQQASQLARPWTKAGCKLLLDVDAGSQYGGSGQPLHWQSVRQWFDQDPDGEWILAGGLNPENVVQAIEISGACAVDVASGVEQPRGRKSAERIAAFAALAGDAFERM